ncbi:hypothetical protein [Nakamurella sp.]|uniref:hypothetical protein n=1 Tax=Nakamurella sp. TaxID=1869182 RepID=UPI003783CE73
MTMSDTSPSNGRPWRQRVHRLTAGVVGAAVLATGGVTVMLATDAAASTSTAPVATGSASDGAATSSTGLGTGAGTSTGSLRAPAQAPTHSSGSGHAATGGS